MRERVWNYIKEYGLLEPGDRVVAALSGGADSVCLLSVLKELGHFRSCGRCMCTTGCGARKRTGMRIL